jgi:hypothetical protein
MEFTRFLEIDRNLVAPDAQKSLLLADRVWQEEGCPSDAAALIDTLEKILRRCHASQIWYAPVLLQRKKALERETWRPRSPVHPGSAAIPAAAASSGETESPEGTCAFCGGTGIVVRKGGFSGSMCSCGALLRRFQSGG